MTSHLRRYFIRLLSATLLIISLAACRPAPTAIPLPTDAGASPTPTLQPLEKPIPSATPTLSTSTILARVPVDPDTVVFFVGEGYLWTGNLRGQVCRFSLTDYSRLDPCTQLDFLPASISTGPGTTWVSGQKSEQETLEIRVARISVVSGQLEDVLELRLNSNGNKILFFEEMVWLTDPAELTGSRIFRIHPQTNQVVGEPIQSGTEPLALVAGPGSLWTANHDDGTLDRLDPKTGKIVSTIDVGLSLHGLTYGAGSLWTANWHDQSVSRIDPIKQQVIGERIRLDLSPGLIAAGDDAVWAADLTSETDPVDDRLIRIDPDTNQVVEELQIGARMMGMQVHEGTLWVLTENPSEILLLSP